MSQFRQPGLAKTSVGSALTIPQSGIGTSHLYPEYLQQKPIRDDKEKELRSENVSFAQEERVDGNKHLSLGFLRIYLFWCLYKNSRVAIINIKVVSDYLNDLGDKTITEKIKEFSKLDLIKIITDEIDSSEIIITDRNVSELSERFDSYIQPDNTIFSKELIFKSSISQVVIMCEKIKELMLPDLEKINSMIEKNYETKSLLK